MYRVIPNTLVLCWLATSVAEAQSFETAAPTTQVRRLEIVCAQSQAELVTEVRSELDLLEFSVDVTWASTARGGGGRCDNCDSIEFRETEVHYAVGTAHFVDVPMPVSVAERYRVAAVRAVEVYRALALGLPPPVRQAPVMAGPAASVRPVLGIFGVTTHHQNNVAPSEIAFWFTANIALEHSFAPLAPQSNLGADLGVRWLLDRTLALELGVTGVSPGLVRQTARIAHGSATLMHWRLGGIVGLRGDLTQGEFRPAWFSRLRVGATHVEGLGEADPGAVANVASVTSPFASVGAGAELRIRGFGLFTEIQLGLTQPEPTVTVDEDEVLTMGAVFTRWSVGLVAELD